MMFDVNLSGILHTVKYKYHHAAAVIESVKFQPPHAAHYYVLKTNVHLNYFIVESAGIQLNPKMHVN